MIRFRYMARQFCQSGQAYYIKQAVAQTVGRWYILAQLKLGETVPALALL